MEKFAFQTRNEDKTFTITLQGFFLEEDGKRFVEGYTEQVKSFNPKEYTLIVDSTAMSAVQADLLSGMEQSFELYMSTGFKKMIFVNPAKQIVKHQLMRVSKEAHITADFVDTMEEAMKKAKG